MTWIWKIQKQWLKTNSLPYRLLLPSNLPMQLGSLIILIHTCEHTAHSALDGWEPRRGPGRSRPWTYRPLREAPAGSRTLSARTPQARYAPGTQTLRTYVYRGLPQDRGYYRAMVGNSHVWYYLTTIKWRAPMQGIFQFNNVLCLVTRLQQACIGCPFGQLQASGPIASTT